MPELYCEDLEGYTYYTCEDYFMDTDRSSTLPTFQSEEMGLSNETIRTELNKVLGSPEFAARPVLRNFLSFVVEKAPAGQAHKIKEYTVAIEVFGRGENFNGLKDSIVRMQAGRLRRALERY